MVSKRHIPARSGLLAILGLMCAAALLVPGGAYAVTWGSISGTVTDADTTDPVFDMAVDLYVWDDGASDWSFYNETYTDGAGEYAFTDLGPGDYIVGAIDWYGTYLEQWYSGESDMYSADTIPINGNNVTANFPLEQAPHGTITGSVIDEAYHEGLGGIYVTAYAYDASDPGFMNWVGDSVTENDGTYSIDVPAGQICLEFADWDGANYIGEFYNNTRIWTSATKIAVADGATVSNINATLSAGGHITGTVTAQSTGEPLEGVRVIALAPPYGEEEIYETFSRVDGTYDIGGLPTNSYLVQFMDIGQTDPSYERVYLDEFYNGVTLMGSATAVSVTAPATRASINASMQVGNGISGTVTKSGSGDPIWLAGWEQGMQVGLYNAAEEEVMWTMADSEGHYRFGGVPDGTYKVKFFDWGWDAVGDPGNQFYVTQWYNNKADFGAATAVTVATQDERTGINAAMVSTGTWGTISGAITDAVNGQAIPGALITPYVEYEDGGETWWTESWDVPPVYTNNAGQYFLDYVPVGSYRLLCAGWMDWEYDQLFGQLAGYEPVYYASASFFEDASDIPVSAGGNVEGVDQVLVRSAELVLMQGTLLDGTSGGPVGAGIPVKLLKYESDGDYFWEYAQTVTNASGFWCWPVQEGSYILGFNQQDWSGMGFTQSQTYAPGWYDSVFAEEDAVPVATIAGGPTTVNDALTRATHVTGNVSDTSGALEGATVHMLQFDGTYWNEVASAQTNASGNYDVGALKPGDYRIMFSPPWPNPERLAAEVYPNRPTVDWGGTYSFGSATYIGYSAVLEPGVEFKGVVDRDDSIANVNQDIKVHAWFDDPVEGWIEIQSTYAYSMSNDQFWLPVLPAGDYKLEFDDPDTLEGYASLWYSDAVSSGAADVITPLGGSLRLILQTMDALPPVTTTNAQGGYKGPASIDLDATDAVVGVDSTYYSLDGAPDVEGTHVDVTDEGWHELTYYSVDKLGNTESARTALFEIFPPGTLETVPIAGNTRIDTAIAASQEAFDDDEADTVVIATAYNWPDALGGAALAGAYDGPILLTKPDDLPSTVAAEIDRLGAEDAVILGGTAAVSVAVENELNAALTGSVLRISGSNRYATANAVAAKTVQLLGTDYDGTAFAATGGKFPDALGASALAAAKSWPIYLVDPRYDLPATTRTSMQSAGVTDVIILGGTAVVSTTVETSLKSMVGTARVNRLAGADRYDTACVVAQYGVDHAGLFWNRAALATGQNFPDALAGGVLQGRSGSVILLTPAAALDDGVESKLETNADQIAELRYLGGLNAVSQAVRDAAEAAIE